MSPIETVPISVRRCQKILDESSNKPAGVNRPSPVTLRAGSALSSDGGSTTHRRHTLSCVLGRFGDIPASCMTISGERMKAGREHRIPLSSDAISILKLAKVCSQRDFVFPGQGKNPAISEAALLKLVREYRPGLTVHAFRSTFRDWCAEMTNFPREVAEAALAHSLKDQTEAAYQRGDLLLKRSGLMSGWARFCMTAVRDG